MMRLNIFVAFSILVIVFSFSATIFLNHGTKPLRQGATQYQQTEDVVISVAASSATLLSRGGDETTSAADAAADDDGDNVTTTTPVTDVGNHSSKPYLSISSHGKLGNQMFQYAMLYCLSRTTAADWTPYLEGRKSFHRLLKTFGQFLSIPRLPFSSRDVVYITEDAKPFADVTLSRLERLPTGRNVTLIGYFQSHRFFDQCKDDIRGQFRFTDGLRQALLDYLDRKTPHDPDNANASYVRVGIHVRRTSMLDEDRLALGYAPPPLSYYRHAMNYFRSRYDNVLFVVTSDDVNWCRSHLTSEHIVYSTGSVASDLLLLSLCDHIIISLGTFSWWAGWLNKGTTIYYGASPDPDSFAGHLYANNSYIPPDDQYNRWIPVV